MEIVDNVHILCTVGHLACDAVKVALAGARDTTATARQSRSAREWAAAVSGKAWKGMHAGPGGQRTGKVGPGLRCAGTRKKPVSGSVHSSGDRVMQAPAGGGVATTRNDSGFGRREGSTTLSKGLRCTGQWRRGGSGGDSSRGAGGTHPSSHFSSTLMLSRHWRALRAMEPEPAVNLVGPAWRDSGGNDE